MKRFFFPAFFPALLTALLGLLSASAFAQSSGIGSGTGSGTGTGSGSSGSGSNIGSGGDIGSGSQFQSSATAPEFEGFQGVEANSSFVGVNDGVPFIGREDVFGTSTSSTRTSNVRSMSSSSRRTTTTRRSTSRSMTAGRSGSTTSGREVRAATTTDFAFSPMEVGSREASFRTRMGRLPNFRIIPDQVSIQLAQTPTGTVATLSGTVPSTRDRRLIQQLVLLEPGIDKVDNKLEVADSGGKPGESLPTLDPGAGQ